MKNLVLTLPLIASLSCSGVDLITAGSASQDLTGSASSAQPIFSADGQHLVFTSAARNLTTNRTDDRSVNLFWRDMQANKNVLISATPDGSGGNGNSSWPSISSNGQFVAFLSDASDLIPGDSNNSADVFVRDIVAGTTWLVSGDVTGNVPAAPVTNGAPILSADGRYVFFESSASSLTATPDSNATVDVFRRDLQLQVTVLVSKNSGATAAANNSSELASITPDGRRVAFISSATDLMPGASSNRDAYVLDMATNTLFRAGPLTTFFGTNAYRCVTANLSEDGLFVAMLALSDTAPSMLFRHDLDGAVTTLVASNIAADSVAQISTDGRFIAYEDGTNVFRWDANSGTTAIVNVTTNGIAPQSGTARQPRITPDGNGIGFLSDCPDLVAGNPGGLYQLYIRKMDAAETALVSLTADGNPGGSSSEATLFDLSRDLSRVAFDATAGDFVAGDANGVSDVFVRDLAARSTALISARDFSFAPRRTAAGTALLHSTGLSGDGRYLAFASFDTDLVPQDTNRFGDAFVADLQLGSIINAGFRPLPLRGIALSADGRFLAHTRQSEFSGQLFRFDRQTSSDVPILIFGSPVDISNPAISADGNLIAYRDSSNFNVRNVAGGTNEFSASAAGPVYSIDSRDALFTADSRFVIFVSNGNVGTFDRTTRQMQTIRAVRSAAVSANSRFLAIDDGFGLHRWDLPASADQYFGTNFARPSITADGRYIAAEDLNSTPSQVVRIDCSTGESNLISMTSSGARANGRSWSPSISADGRYVAFLTRAIDLVSGHTNQQPNVVVHDCLLGTTLLLSASINGGSGDQPSSKPMFAGDGRTLVFQSMASDLVAGDFNDRRDIFIAKLGGVDSDGDGMDDDWEVAYFGNLSRDGSGDFDGDGVSDRDEFLAGTDPTNAGSVFRALTLTQVGSSTKRVLWTGNSSRAYRVEFKDDLAAATWTALDAPISWVGSTASVADSSGASNRFYRVVRLP